MLLLRLATTSIKNKKRQTPLPFKEKAVTSRKIIKVKQQDGLISKTYNGCIGYGNVSGH